MKREDIIIIGLTIQLTFMSYLYCNAAKSAAYLQGQLDVYSSFSNTGNDGTCFAKGGCK